MRLIATIIQLVLYVATAAAVAPIHMTIHNNAIDFFFHMYVFS